MRVMVLGAGLIGGALAAALRARGHHPVLASRGAHADSPGAIALDFTALPDDTTLVRAMTDVDVLVNTVGIFRQAADQSFDAVHVNGPLRVFEAARSAGVRRVIQLSALGADPESPIPYLASKGRADAALLATCPLECCAVRPSLVFSPKGTSTRWFASLAGLPLTPLPGRGLQRIQPVHLDDLVAVLVRLVEAPAIPAVLEVVGPRPIRLRGYLGLFKRMLGLGGAMVPVPAGLARAGAWLAARAWPRAPVDPDALAMLARGSTADPAPVARWLGRAPRAPETFFDGLPLARMRRTALLAWGLPLMRLSLAVMWIATGVVSLWIHPVASSLDLLAQVGLHGALARVALWTGALLDLAIGVGLLVLRRRHLLYLAQLVLVAAYTLIITVWLPEQWRHPFGPVLKNLPLLAMIAVLAALDRGDGPGPR